MGQSHKFLSYLDIPLQHTHDDILLSMNRPPFETARKIIDLARESVPGIVLRTTILVGFPGETAHHFKKLLGDVQRVAFDWLGVFSYSQEQGTPSFAYAPQVSEHIKNRRRNLLLNVQQGITARSNQKRVGQVFSVMVDEDANQINDHAKGHTWFQAPEIDGIISLTATAKVGELVSCLVTKVGNAFDLIATQLDEKAT